MKRTLQGHYLPISTVGEKARAFVPDPLPPLPPIEWTPELLADADKSALAGLGRAAASVHSVHAALIARPIASAGWIAETAPCSMATANKALAHLERLGIVQRLHEGKRNRLFVYGQYIRILEGDGAFRL